MLWTFQLTQSFQGFRCNLFCSLYQYSESNFNGTLQYARNKRVQVSYIDEFSTDIFRFKACPVSDTDTHGCIQIFCFLNLCWRVSIKSDVNVCASVSYLLMAVIEYSFFFLLYCWTINKKVALKWWQISFFLAIS